MFPVSVLPHSDVMMYSHRSLADLLYQCQTPDAFFRNVAAGEVSPGCKKELNSILFGYLVFDNNSVNYPLLRTLNEALNSFNQETGNNFILWTMLSHSQSGTAFKVRDDDYRVWNREQELFTPKFTSVCLKELGVENHGAPILILAESLSSRTIIVSELKNIEGIFDLFQQISKCAKEYRNGPICKRSAALLQIFEHLRYNSNERRIKGSKSFASTMEKVYSTFLNDPNFRDEIINWRYLQ